MVDPAVSDALLKPLHALRIVSLAVNLPGPLAVARLQQLGGRVVKIEPPQGDPLAQVQSAWYRRLCAEQTIHRLDLKDPPQRARLEEELAAADLLLTASRPSALARLGLGWRTLHTAFPRLCQVALIGYPPPHEELPGHDLTYQARQGLVEPPHLPRTLIADLAGAEVAVSTALALLLARERGQGAHYAQVSLARAAEEFVEPWRQGLTAAGGILGGAWPGYNLYRAREGWVALAALEPHFWQKLAHELALPALDAQQLGEVFLSRTAEEWEAWGTARDLPLAAVRDSSPPEERQ